MVSGFCIFRQMGHQITDTLGTVGTEGEREAGREKELLLNCWWSGAGEEEKESKRDAEGETAERKSKLAKEKERGKPKGEKDRRG